VLKIFLLGAGTGVAILVAGVAVYFMAGIAPAATASSPMPLEDFFAKSALRARISRESPKSVPITADETSYLEGAKIYRDNCAVCHGLPGVPQSAIAMGLFPHAPALFKGKGVTDDEPGETYWKVVNGIRLTGMPGFRQSLSERQAWEVSLLLAHADTLSTSVGSALTAPVEPSTPK
jgi:mono/diheme cytochrome c family protein